MQVTLANWRTAPFNRWAFHHVRELIPSADIPSAVAGVRALESDAIDLGIEEFLRDTDTDGFAVLRDGIACKPAVLAETDDWVAMSSEYRGIAPLPGAEAAKVCEPKPATVYAWGRA